MLGTLIKLAGGAEWVLCRLLAVEIKALALVNWLRDKRAELV